MRIELGGRGVIEVGVGGGGVGGGGGGGVLGQDSAGDKA